MDAPAQLILIATYRCNLACSHCPVARSSKALPSIIARKAVIHYLRFFRPNPARIKICGGEPFLNFTLVKDIVRTALSNTTSCEFTISTNGTLIDKNVFSYLQKHPEIEIWYSPHPAEGMRPVRSLSKLPNTGINLLISPKNVVRVSEEFLKYLNEGYTGFNFLPEYFTRWNDAQVRILKYEFTILSEMIKKLAGRGLRIRIKNLTSSGSTPLFNDGVVIDHNGDVFQNNMILSKHFFYLKDQLKIGNIEHPSKVRWEQKIKYADIFKHSMDKRTYSSTQIVDKALSDFVNLLH
ncbi:MAG TPA: hypothetical protein DCL35_02560 [Candidatus Omnitrophica bacterium]|nr:hypothetical protein [Candidatus Omnitrophota bacterium]